VCSEKCHRSVVVVLGDSIVIIIIIIIIKYICKALDRSATKALKVSRWCRTGTLSVVFGTVSQYSTVVLTVVRVMIAKYRKSGICGYRISLTPEPIELK